MAHDVAGRGDVRAPHPLAAHPQRGELARFHAGVVAATSWRLDQPAGGSESREAFMNSLRAWPSDRASAGTRVAPKSSTTTARMISSSGAPSPAIFCLLDFDGVEIGEPLPRLELL